MPKLAPTHIRPWTLLPLAAAISLCSCGGGGGGTALTTSATPVAAHVSLTGTAADAPIANAVITITAGAPLGDSGASTIGSVTANATGGYTVQAALPTGSVPIFANAVDPTDAALVLTSYLGQSDVLATSGAFTTTNLPDLDISPVTTAALAVYAQTGTGGYAALTPTTYAQTLQSYGSDILAIAAGIKAVGDKLCSPTAAITSTTNLATAIATQANLTGAGTTTLSAAATILGGNCATVLAALPQSIAADPNFGPELQLGDVIDAGIQSVAAGTYQLQGVIAETGRSSTGAAVAATPPAVVTDTSVNVDATGTVTSSDGHVSGAIVGNALTLQITSPTGSTYTFRGKIGSIPAALVTGGQAYAAQGGGSNGATGAMATLAVVLAPAGTNPAWNGITPPNTQSRSDGVNCPAGNFAVRFDAYGPSIGGASVGSCIAPSATGWTMTTPASTSMVYDIEHAIANNIVGLQGNAPSFSAPSWGEVGTPSAPFVLEATGATFTLNGATTNGNAYYVMGSQSVVFAGTQGNALLGMHGNALTQLSESMHNQDTASTQQGDH